MKVTRKLNTYQITHLKLVLHLCAQGATRKEVKEVVKDAGCPKNSSFSITCHTGCINKSLFPNNMEVSLISNLQLFT